MLMYELHNTVIVITLTGTYLYFWKNMLCFWTSLWERYFVPHWCACGLLTMPFFPSVFWCCLQIVPKEVRFQLNEAPMGTAWITSCPWGKTNSWLICASLARSKEVLLQNPLQEDRLHSFTVLKILKKCTTFKVDSKSCCSCCYSSWLQSQHGALCCRIQCLAPEHLLQNLKILERSSPHAITDIEIKEDDPVLPKADMLKKTT